MLDLTIGSRWGSAVCETEVIVVKAPAGPVDLRCGGAPVVPLGTARGDAAPSADHANGTLIGKRYAADEVGLEVLCSKGGAGSLSIGDVPIEQKDAKPLPSSD